MILIEKTNCCHDSVIFPYDLFIDKSFNSPRSILVAFDLFGLEFFNNKSSEYLKPLKAGGKLDKMQKAFQFIT